MNVEEFNFIENAIWYRLVDFEEEYDDSESFLNNYFNFRKNIFEFKTEIKNIYKFNIDFLIHSYFYNIFPYFRSFKLFKGCFKNYFKHKSIIFKTKNEFLKNSLTKNFINIVYYNYQNNKIEIDNYISKLCDYYFKKEIKDKGKKQIYDKTEKEFSIPKFSSFKDCHIIEELGERIKTYKRIEKINFDDVLNLKIVLNTTNNVEEFLKSI